MGEVIELEHIRRSRRLFVIFLERFGVEHFLSPDPERPFPPRVDAAKIDDAVLLAATWIERRTGTAPPAATRRRMALALRRALVQKIAERMVRAGL